MKHPDASPLNRHGRDESQGSESTHKVVLNHECLDASAASALTDSLTKAADHQLLFLDCAKVKFADSSGLGLLIRLQSQYPGRVHLLNVQPVFRRFFAKVAKGLLPPERSEVTLPIGVSRPDVSSNIPMVAATRIDPAKVGQSPIVHDGIASTMRRAHGATLPTSDSYRAVRYDEDRKLTNLENGYVMSQPARTI
ncbi:MAG: STAS domain-containing protein [Gemmataceae bacterium]